MYLTPSQPPPTFVAGNSSGVAPPRSSLNPAPMWDPLPTKGNFSINGRQFGNDPGAAWAELAARAYVGSSDVQSQGTARGQIETKVKADGSTPLVGVANGQGDAGPVYRIQPAPVDSRLDVGLPLSGTKMSGVSSQIEWGVHFDTRRIQTGEAPPGRPPLGPQRDQLSVQYPRVEVLGGRDRNPGQMGLRYDFPRAGTSMAQTMGAGEPVVSYAPRPGTEMPQRPSMVPQSYTRTRYPVAETEPIIGVARKTGGVDRGWRAPPKTTGIPGAPAAERGDVTQPQSHQIQLDKLLTAQKLPRTMTVFQEARTLEDSTLVTSDRKNRYATRVR